MFFVSSRPVVQYTRKLDEKENPAMGKVLADCYLTLTARDYSPFLWKYSGETIGRVIPTKRLNSGYAQELKTTIPNTKELKKILAKPISEEDLCTCKHKLPLLHQLQKGRGSLERCGAGYMSTEANSSFAKLDYHNKDVSRDLYLKDIGPKESSASCTVHNKPNPITSEISGMVHITTRSTEDQVPVTYTDFQYTPKKRYIPRVSPSSTKRSGFTLNVSTDCPFLGKIQTTHGICLPSGQIPSMNKVDSTSTQVDSYPWPKEEDTYSSLRYPRPGWGYPTGYCIGNTPRGFPGDWSVTTEPWMTTTLETFKDYEISKSMDLNDLVIPMQQPPFFTRQYELHSFNS